MLTICSYGTLLLVDLEDEILPAEVSKLEDDVTSKGLSVVVFADWYDEAVLDKIGFFDENTRSWWTPVTGYVGLAFCPSSADCVIRGIQAPHRRSQCCRSRCCYTHTVIHAAVLLHAGEATFPR